MAAYHLEALRRQRVIDRKNAALMRIELKKKEEESLKSQNMQYLENNSSNNNQTSSCNCKECHKICSNCEKFKKDKQTQVNYTQKDLRYQHKILRDHGLYMGHVNENFFS
nr:uncharacterized protein LOC100209373 isoform X1 [Hydra vulgaris]